jgi:hypothetical protein
MKTLLWKYYFWAVLALDVISFVMPLERRVWEMAEIGFFLVALLGLFGYCWKKQMLNRLFWQVFFVAFLCWIPLYFIVLPRYFNILPPLPSQTGLGKTSPAMIFTLAAVTIMVHVPLFAALFLYAFKRGDIWEG